MKITNEQSRRLHTCSGSSSIDGSIGYMLVENEDDKTGENGESICLNTVSISSRVQMYKT